MYDTLTELQTQYLEGGFESEEEYNEFYKQKFYDYKDPLMHILLNIEGNVEYKSLLYIPSEVPYNLYSEKFEKGLQLNKNSLEKV